MGAAAALALEVSSGSSRWSGVRAVRVTLRGGAGGASGSASPFEIWQWHMALGVL
jgi:hypothetical protein